MKNTVTSIRKNTRYYINVAIGLALMFLFPLIGPVGPITAVGIRVLGIFLGMVWLWIVADGMWPSLLAVIQIALSGYVAGAEGYGAITSALSATFGNETLLNITFIMLIFAAVSELGLTDHIVQFFMKRKALEGRPYLMLFLFMVSGYVIGGTTDPIIGMYILWPSVSTLCTKYGYKKSDKTFAVMIMAMFLASICGQSMLGFKGMTAALFGVFQKTTGLSINLAVYLVFHICMALVVMGSFLLLVRFVFRPDFTALKQVKVEDIVKESVPMTKAQKLIGALLIALIAGILLPNVLPASVPGVKLLKTYGVLGIEGVLMAIAMVCRDKDGKALIDVREIAKNGFSWIVFFQCAAAIYVANALTSDATGIKALLISVFQPILGGLPGMLFVVAVIVAALVLTQVLNNMVCGVIVLTVAMPFMEIVEGVGFPALAVMTIMSVCMAALLPSGSIYCSYLHSNKQLIDMKDIYKIFIPTLALIAIVYCCIGYPVAAMLFR